MPTITARYDAYSTFHIPNDIPLLSNEDNDDEGVKAWSWWIKWNILHYIDDKGVEHEIEPTYSTEMKYCDDIDMTE